MLTIIKNIERVISLGEVLNLLEPLQNTVLNYLQKSTTKYSLLLVTSVVSDCYKIDTKLILNV